METSTMQGDHTTETDLQTLKASSSSSHSLTHSSSFSLPCSNGSSSFPLYQSHLSPAFSSLSKPISIAPFDSFQLYNLSTLPGGGRQKSGGQKCAHPPCCHVCPRARPILWVQRVGGEMVDNLQ